MRHVAEMFLVIFILTSCITIVSVFVDIIVVVAMQSAIVVLVITIYRFRMYSELRLYSM